MKSGRPKWWSKVSRPVAERIREAVRGGESCPDIFARFNIGQYQISARYWRKEFGRLTREFEMRQTPPTGEQRSADAATLLQCVLDSIQTTVDRNGQIDSTAVKALTATVGVLKLDIWREVNKRAEEKHEATMRKLTPRVNEAIERVTEGGKAASREDILREIGLALRGEEAAEA